VPGKGPGNSVDYQSDAMKKIGIGLSAAAILLLSLISVAALHVYRYDLHPLSSERAILLDRWTGEICVIKGLGVEYRPQGRAYCEEPVRRR
jgi:hypothetical protein